MANFANRSASSWVRQYAMTRCNAVVSLALCAFSLLSTITPAQAETFCVHDSPGLQTALDSAATNGEDDLIKMQLGIYGPATASGFLADVSDSHGLSIGGGFDTSPGGVPCGIQLHGSQWSSIDGAGSKALLNIKMKGGNAPFTMYALTFVNGFSQDATPVLAIDGSNSWSGDVGIENLAVKESNAKLQLMQISTCGRIFVRSSAVTRNKVETTQSGVLLTLFINSPSVVGAGMYFNSNTVVANKGAPYVVRFAGNSMFDVSVSNSIIWNDSGDDILFNGGDMLYLDHSDIGPRDIRTGTVIETNAYVDAPEFAGPMDFRLGVSSVLRDGGENSASGGIGSFDVEGSARIFFGAVDVGAYEWKDWIFQYDFE